MKLCINQFRILLLPDVLLNSTNTLSDDMVTLQFHLRNVVELVYPLHVLGYLPNKGLLKDLLVRLCWSPVQHCLLTQQQARMIY